MTKYALIIAIPEYDYFKPLEKTTQDAEAIAKILHQYGDYDITRFPRKGNAETAEYEMKAGKVTDEDLYNELELFLTKTANNQPALIYFTGHGFSICDRLGREKGFLATSNCKVTIKDNQIIKQDNAVPLDDLNYLIEQANLSELVLLLDCCHSGNYIETHLMQKSFNTFEYKQNYYLITACRSFETAKTIRKAEYSVFSGAVIEGLSDKNKDEKGKISCDRLFDFVNTKIGGKLQTPRHIGIGGSITLVKYLITEGQEIPEIEPIRDNQGNIVCPYQGLNVFTAKEKDFFFGRQRLTEDIKQKSENFGVIPIIGASGSGKSSVVYAGVMAWLEAENQEWYILPTTKPGIEPLSEFRRVFKDYVSVDEAELKEIIEDEEREMSNIIEFLPNSRKYFLFIDQFEEVFTLCRLEDHRRRFIELITNFKHNSKENIVIAIAMRADFLDRCLQYQSLYETIQHRAIYMPPLDGKDKQDIIIKPAERQGYRIESSLLVKLLSDVGRKQGFLPLLEFALTLLWEKRDETTKTLTLDAYEKLGEDRSPLTPLNQGVNDKLNTGLTKALDIYAEKVYNYQDYNRDNPQKERTETEKELIKLIFLRLIRTNNQEPDTRQRQPKNILLNIANEDPEKHKILEKLIYGKQGLVNARLLVTGADISSNSIHKGWVDLVHEALIEGWQRFKQWREENRDLLRLSERLEEQRQEWLNHPISENLMMGGRLRQVRQQWEKLHPYLLYPTEATNFYNQSEEEYKRYEAIKKENEQRNSQLKYSALHDTLTALPNRSLFLERIEFALKRFHEEEDYLFAVLVIDLDRFKMINDSNGHLVGDRLLIEVSRTLETLVSPADTVARLGGDEFAILLDPIDDVNEALKVAQEIKNALTTSFIIQEKEVFTSPSIGLTVSLPNYQSAIEILRDADIAMGQAKEKGRGRYEIFNQQMHAQALKLLTLETDLRHGIDKEEFEVYYQPIMRLDSLKLVGFEALVRWQHPHKGFISPGEFIPVAENTGLIIPLGTIVLEKVCHQIQTWNKNYPDTTRLKVSVNLSSKQFNDVELLQKIDKILNKTDLDSNNLNIEFTETSLIEHSLEERTILLLKELKKRNLEICLDDFGTVYSSLSYLHRFPVDTLKIDRSFINSIGQPEQNLQIIQSIITLAHNLGIDVIANGIDNPEQLIYLQQLKCDYGQGNFFSRPLPPDEIQKVFLS